MGARPPVTRIRCGGGRASPPSRGFLKEKKRTMMRQNHQLTKQQKRLPRQAMVLAASLAWCLCLVPGCAEQDSGSPPAAQVPVEQRGPAMPAVQGWAGSAEELIRAVALAVSRQDRQALEKFCISREEYLALVWPELPVSSVEQWKDQSGFVWSQHAAKSAAGLREVLARYGNALHTGALRYAAPVQAFGSVQIHQKPELVPQRKGTPGTAVRLMGSIIEHAGRYKVFSYNMEK